MLQLDKHCHLVDLDPQTLAHEPLVGEEVVQAQLAVLKHLVEEVAPQRDRTSPEDLAASSCDDRDRLLRPTPWPAVATTSTDPTPYVPSELIPTLADSLYASSGAPSFPPSFSRIKRTRGDFTRLDASSPNSGTLALVNPANIRMLGCFKPDHPCADHVLHAAAGPSLSAACARVMRARDWADVRTAEDVLLTRGYALRAQYVLHVAGPQLPYKGAAPTDEQVRQLETVYTRCLDVADELGTITTVAFPCISTGLFHFPGALAARIALRTVTSWLDAHPTASSAVSNVVFVLFSQRDADNYEAALAAVCSSLQRTQSEPNTSSAS